uniref:PPM-type phosphatase domain-containing protein n=1 Tax=Glossina morsitans morsitans TaxID=37546 RepID=A0A1B0GAU5_GLOMM
MSNTKYEITNSSKVTNCLPNEPNECIYLEEFKTFLRELSRSLGDNVLDNGTELRNCVTRGNNETYPVTEGEELQAEILMQIWQQLHVKQCPEHFKMALLKLVLEQIYGELKNAKIRDQLQIMRLSIGDTDAVNVCYDLLKLQKFINQWVDKTLLHLSDNSKEENLKTYADCFNKSDKTSNAFSYTEFHIKNKPRKMEDRHTCMPRFSEMLNIKDMYSFYGVFDGHSGSLAATYAANQLPYLISQQLKRRPDVQSQSDCDFYREAFETAFLQADQNFAQKSICSGTTAVCALLKYNAEQIQHLYIAWVGDSKALLVSPTMQLQLVKAHKPDNIDERKRIESLEIGGAVMFVQGQWRVNGIINVSRSIGDSSVKAVIAEPDFVDIPLQATHDFLLLGSDGLWDHVGEKHIVQTVYKGLDDNEQSLEDIPKHLIELAKQGDSQDNITVILVLLKDRSKINENYKKYQEK